MNFDFALEPPRPIAPNTVYVGPLMPRQAADLPAPLAAWLAGSEAGSDSYTSSSSGGDSSSLLPVVLISFGSSFVAPDAALPALAEALLATADVARFLVRARSSESEGLTAALAAAEASRTAADDADAAASGSGPPPPPGWLRLEEWLPQNDILSHPSVTAFVTQGGYLSMQVCVGGGSGQTAWCL